MKTDIKYQNAVLIFGGLWLVFDLFFMRGELNLYLSAPNLDIFSHFFFGLFLGALALFLRTPFKAIMIYTLVISLFWEWLEKIGDKLFEQPVYLLDYFFYDGIIDIIAHFVAVWFVYTMLPKWYK